MEELLKNVLEKITPTGEEHEREKKLVSLIERKLKEKGVRPILVGSLAKGTDLRADKDIDLFMLFPSDLGRDELKKRGLSIGKALFSELGAEYEIDYAEHPYVKGLYGDYVIEVVPCYDTRKPKSAVDRTPYHTQYVKKKIREKKGLAGEIRLLKQFMKGAGVYGAEAKVEGFSGYLTELLVIEYGSFRESLEAVSGWKFNEVLDPEGLWGDKDALRLFFPDASLIVVDPIDENRNAAAAVSKQRLAEFIVAASEFLKEPHEEFFFPKIKPAPTKKQLLERLNARGTRTHALVFKHHKINPNTLYSQLRKSEAAAKKSLEGFEFRVLKSSFWTDEESLSIILFEFDVWALPRIMHHAGPVIDCNPRDQERFLEKHKDCKPYVKGGRWVVDIEREFVDVRNLLSRIALEKKGFGKNLREVKKIEVIEGEAILEIDSEGYRRFLGSFLSPV